MVFTRRGGTTIIKVEKLINPATDRWDTRLLEKNFHPIDMCRI
jgi:hypothetical protein